MSSASGHRAVVPLRIVSAIEFCEIPSALMRVGAAEYRVEYLSAAAYARLSHEERAGAIHADRGGGYFRLVKLTPASGG